MAKGRRREIKKVWTRIYLREWREYRRMSQERLSALSGISVATISQIETGQSAGSPESLEALAKALTLQVGEMLDVEPSGKGAILRIWVSDEDRDRARRLIEALSHQ